MEGPSPEQGDTEAGLLPGRPARRLRSAVIGGSAALVVLAVSAGALAGLVPGVPLRSGPLDGGSSTEILAPVREGDAGVFWGVLELRGPSDGSMVLDGVKIDENPDKVGLLTAPYVWDESRFEILTDGGVSAYPIPFPEDMTLPPRQKVNGFAMKPGESAQVAFELATPEKAATVEGIKVRYHVGWMAYEKTFDMSLTLCPPVDPELCQ
ncbi:hypothetical protein LWF15_20090 [Kineosporia rhizophila]|uniref:hypothetical protein n=1 Tax=Kineosporia TaxID=49184 RepID=UPI000B18333B|nr:MULTISPECIES: hypothetical protein [Kineosporia]MCE0537798.1 hypothetical protein [Kineosporia rhizophila]GLY15786.1 hypothetical protein Kisp01_28010 [Kineosporia sp. NBRC 101677]